MLLKINQRSEIPIFRQIVEEIKTMIASGELHPGKQLPSIRELAVLLNINPNTIAKAYKQLESEGFLTTRKGVGVFVHYNLDESIVKELKTEIINKKINELIQAVDKLGIKKEELINEIKKHL